MGDRTDVLVRIPTPMLRELELLYIERKKTKGIAWSRNDEIIAAVERWLKGKKR